MMYALILCNKIYVIALDKTLTCQLLCKSRYKTRCHTPLYTDAPPLDSPARAMSYTAIEQSMPSYHSPVILRKVEVANRRNHVMKFFFRKFDFHKNIIFVRFFS